MSIHVFKTDTRSSMDQSEFRNIICHIFNNIKVYYQPAI
jgi:hypothetical protein